MPVYRGYNDGNNPLTAIRRKNPMKKLVSLLLALVMMTSVCSSALAEDRVNFQPTLLGMIEQPAAYWNSSDVMRVTFVASLLTDLVRAGHESYSSTLIDGVIAQGAGYFCCVEEKDQIIVYAFGEKQTLLVIYDPATNACTVGHTDATVAPSIAQQFIDYTETENGYTFHSLDGLAVYQYFEEIVSIITGQ